jgi:hypothetical protein
MKPKLPRHVTAFHDRHGKERFRYRKDGISRYLRGPLGSPEFKADLRAAKDAEPTPEVRANAGTVNELVSRYYGSATFLKPGSERQKVVRSILEAFRADYGGDSSPTSASTISRRSCWPSRKSAGSESALSGGRWRRSACTSSSSGCSAMP